MRTPEKWHWVKDGKFYASLVDDKGHEIISTDSFHRLDLLETHAHLIAASPSLLEELRLLVTYVQKELIPNVREIVGGQEVLDRSWDRVAAGYKALALTKPNP